MSDCLDKCVVITYQLAQRRPQSFHWRSQASCHWITRARPRLLGRGRRYRAGALRLALGPCNSAHHTASAVSVGHSAGTRHPRRGTAEKADLCRHRARSCPRAHQSDPCRCLRTTPPNAACGVSACSAHQLLCCSARRRNRNATPGTWHAAARGRSAEERRKARDMRRRLQAGTGARWSGRDGEAAPLIGAAVRKPRFILA